jgi:hypothetical protein
MAFKFWVIGLTSMLLLASVGLADHLPPELQARGKPEKTLAGIHLDRSKVSDVIKIYGAPSKAEMQSKPADLNVGDTYDYFWTKPGMKLHLIVYRGAHIVRGEYIALIEIERTKAKGSVGGTGSGLKLGDGLKDLRRIYGRRFEERKLPKLNIHDVMIQWRSEEISLVAVFDKQGKISKLSLMPPE